jgi:isoaspartyl peptidase/L-asparaginase-like protein (Ntn-hydrolase superfamily)
MARAACVRIREGRSPREAAIEAVGLLKDRAHGEGGIITAGPDGRLGWSYNTPRMARAFIRAGMSSAKAAV